MKRLLLPVALICGAPAVANAQLLPIPGKANADWVLFKVEPQPYDAQALAIPPPPNRMPNAVQKSIRGIGNHHYYWDAKRQFAYEWYSKEGKTEPDYMVLVREQRKDSVYTYRRANFKFERPPKPRK
jgi:hypothetical protein